MPEWLDWAPCKLRRPASVAQGMSGEESMESQRHQSFHSLTFTLSHLLISPHHLVAVASHVGSEKRGLWSSRIARCGRHGELFYISKWKKKEKAKDKYENHTKQIRTVSFHMICFFMFFVLLSFLF